MGLFDSVGRFFQPTTPKLQPIVRPAISIQPTGKAVVEEKTQYNKAYGQPHPYNFELCESAYYSVPIVQGAIDKMVDFIVGPGYYVTCEDKRVVEACERFFNKHQFTSFLECVARNELVFGCAFAEKVMELDGKDVHRLKVLDPKTIFIEADEYGEIQKFNQRVKMKSIPLEKNTMLFFKFNPLGDSLYGTSALRSIIGDGSKKSALAQKLSMEENMLTILERKAGAPLHVKLGSDEYPANQTDIDAFAGGLEAMRTHTEWVTNHVAEINAIGFEGKVINQEPYLNYFEHNIMYGLQVPEVLLGKGSIPEGLAEVQMEAFERRIKSIQESLEKTIEDELLNPWLRATGIITQPGVRAEFEWGPATPEDEWKKSLEYGQLLSIPGLDPTTIAGIENKMRQALGIEGEVKPKLAVPALGNGLSLPTSGLNAGGNPYQNASPAPKYPQPKLGEKYGRQYEVFTTLPKEVFESYSVHDYMKQFVKNYEFTEITDDKDRAAAKIVFRKGVPLGWSARELQQALEKAIGDKGKAEQIVRTELARVETEASLLAYEASPVVEEVEFRTAEDSMVCTKCARLNKKTYTLTQAHDIIPGETHPQCRCSIIPRVSEATNDPFHEIA